MMKASMDYHYSSFEKLLKEKQIAFLASLLKNNCDSLQLFDNEGNSLFHLAVQLECLEAITLFHLHGLSLNLSNNAGVTPLHLAAIKGKTEAIQLLYQHGANLLLTSKNTGKHVLHYAVHYGQTEIVQQLLKLSTELQRAHLIETKDHDGKTVLQHAAFQANPQIVLLLVQAGADVNTTDYQGNTPLHFAASHGYLKVLKALLSQGATSVLNTNGYLPLHVARTFEQLSTYQYLLIQQQQALGSTLSSPFSQILDDVDKSFSYANTLDTLQTVVDQYTRLIMKAEDSNAWAIISYCSLQLSEVYLQMATIQGQLITSEKNTMKANEILQRQTSIYAKSAKFASVAECMAQRLDKFLYNNNPEPRNDSDNSFISSDIKCSLLTSKLFLIQQQRLQIRYMRDIAKSQIIFSELPAKFILAARQQLKQLRQQLACDIKNPKFTTEFLLQWLTQGFIDLTHQLLKPCIATLGPPPCAYAFLGLGSMARGEMSPYSDLEFAILIESDMPQNRLYFRHLTRLLELQVISLNETKLMLLQCGTLSPIPSGFSFDSGGNTPLGKEGLFELIGTPEQLAQFQRMKSFEEELITSNVLKIVCHLTGEITLTRNYEKAVNFELNQVIVKTNMIAKFFKRENDVTVRQQQALQLLTGDLAEYTPQLDQKKEQLGYFDIKKELYRLPSSILQEISLFYGIIAKGTWAKLKTLYERKYLSQSGLKHLTELFDQVLRYRLKAHLFYEQEQESLYHPQLIPINSKSYDMSKSAKFSILPTKRLELKNDELDQLVEFHKVLLPLERAAKAFCYHKGQVANFWEEKNFYDDSLMVQGYVFQEKLDYKNAAACYDKALALNPNDLESLNRLGNLKAHLGETEGRITRLEKALALALKIHGENHPLVALNYSNIGSAYENLGDAQRGMFYYEKALEIKLKIYNASHPEIAANYSNMGNAFGALGDARQAVVYYEKALLIWLKAYGREHPIVATGYNNLGFVCRVLSNTRQAVEYHEKALSIRLKAYDAGHPEVAMSYENLGLSYKDLGNAKQAVVYQQKALSIKLRIYGEGHPHVATSYNNLGLSYQDLNDAHQAVAYYKKALTIWLKAYSGEHPAVAACYNELGRAYEALTDIHQALFYYEKALTIWLKVYGEKHPAVAICYNNLGYAYKVSGNIQQAIIYHQRALTIMLKIYGEGHPHVAAVHKSLALAYKALSNTQPIPLLKQLRNAANQNNAEAVKHLISQIKEIDEVDSNPLYKRNALHWAVSKNALECVKILIEANAQVTIPDAHGKTALDLAYESQQEALISVIEKAFLKKYKLVDLSQLNLEKGLRNAAVREEINDLAYFIRLVKNINAQDDGQLKRTALHWAVAKNKGVECIKLLLEADALATLPDAEGLTANLLAQNNTSLSIQAFFHLNIFTSPPLSSTIKEDPSHIATRNNNAPQTAFFVDSKSKVEASEPEPNNRHSLEFNENLFSIG